jgi:hypothetical protein
MKKFKISTVAAIAVYAMLAAVFILQLVGFVLMFESEMNMFMCYLFTAFSLVGFFWIVSIVNDKIRY